jgi:hypothetical protein
MAIIINKIETIHKRIPTRPLELQGERFTANFDNDTLFYDCFRQSATQVMIIAPALFNLRELLDNSTFYVGNTPVKAKIEAFKLVTRIKISVPATVREITLKGAIGDYTLPIRENYQDEFAGLRVITTVQKDNDLIWIEDWVKFYRDVHGAEAVLIYDNGSTRYSLDVLEERLAAIEGLKRVKIVSWDFIYGPGPPPAMPSSKKYWDSNFCQAAALEHARHCFLQKAKCVNFTDIDELIVSKNQKSIFEVTENSFLGLTMTAGRWVVAVDKREGTPRHHDFNTLLKVKPSRKYKVIPHDANSCKTKWTIVPHKLPQFVCLDVHKILNYPPSRIPSREFTFRHFRNINLSWFDPRIKIDQFTDETHEVDHDLMRDFTKIKE